MDGSQASPVTVAEQPRNLSGTGIESNSLTAVNVKSWIHEILDWIVKLLPVIATVLVAYVADHYKASLTASTLLSEREKADSQLRSEMFSKLVDPISGAKSGADVTLEREQLLAELLSLNFHEHIGLKPLLNHVDMRLARERKGKSGDEATELDAARESFRSVAKTVISRQTAMLTRSSGDSRHSDAAHIQRIDIGISNSNEKFANRLKEEKAQLETFGEPITIENPAQTHRLFLTLTRADWANETFRVEVSIHSIKPDVELAKRDFELSWFDFPLTDNTLLADGTRFAFVLDEVYDATKRFDIDWPENRAANAAMRVRMNVVWFPKDFIAARERPTNYREFRKSLGLDD
jgi:hypothetical protein